MKTTQTEKAKNKNSSVRIIVPALLIIIIVFQTGWMIYNFAERKESYHGDEIYSFGLANNADDPFIEADDYKSLDLHNINEWRSSVLFRNYLTVQKDERFRYDSVWKNQAADRHPPFFYALIHTICSFFPEQFSFTYGFIPNLICFAVSQFFLYLLAKHILRSKSMALLVVFFWGTTMAAVDMVIFIRMYCMLEMWSVILMYLHQRLYESKAERPVGLLIAIAAVTFFGGFTQYLFLVVAFLTTVCFCIWFLLRKRFGMFFAYGFSVLGGVALFFAVFPAAFDNFFGESGRSVGDLFGTQLRISVNYVFQDLLRIIPTDLVFPLIVIAGLIPIAVIMSLPLLFLFRDRIPFGAMAAKIRGSLTGLGKKVRSTKPKEILRLLTECSPVPFICIFCSAEIVVLTAHSINYMLGFISRYFFLIYPLLILGVFAVVYIPLKKYRFTKAVFSVIAVIISVRAMLFTPMSPVWTKEKGMDLESTVRDSNVIVVADDKDKYLMLSTFSCELYETDSFFFTSLDDLPGSREKLSEVPNDKAVYMMLYNLGDGSDEKGDYINHMVEGEMKHKYVDDITEPFTAMKGYTSCERLGEYTFVVGSCIVYKVNFDND